MSEHSGVYDAENAAGKGSEFPRAEAVGKRRPRVDLASDMEWVYDNLWLEGVQPKDAPSVGAWGYLQHLKRDSKSANEFYLLVGRRGMEQMKDRLSRLSGGDEGEAEGMLEAVMDEDYSGEDAD